MTRYIGFPSKKRRRILYGCESTYISFVMFLCTQQNTLLLLFIIMLLLGATNEFVGNRSFVLPLQTAAGK